MLTLRRYFNLADAALAKSLLDDYEVFCSIWDENINISVGAYLAAPARLVVADRQFERAARILSYAETSSISDDELPATADEAPIKVLDEAIFGEPEQPASGEPFRDNNPWEILVLAYLFLAPGVGFISEKRSLILVIKKWGRHRFLVLSPFELHVLGTVLAGATFILIAFYFYARRAIARDQSIDLTS
jgi:Putative prokaryotic signal transducing protein